MQAYTLLPLKHAHTLLLHTLFKLSSYPYSVTTMTIHSCPHTTSPQYLPSPCPSLSSPPLLRPYWNGRCLDEAWSTGPWPRPQRHHSPAPCLSEGHAESRGEYILLYLRLSSYIVHIAKLLNVLPSLNSYLLHLLPSPCPFCLSSPPPCLACLSSCF